MQFALLILFMIQSAEQTEDAEFFFSPPLLLQDRCERSWQSRSTCIPAMDAHGGPIRRFRLSFQRKIQASAGGRVAFILKSRPSWATLALCAHFAAPPASTPIAVIEASAAVAAAPHQRGLPTETRPALAEEGNFTHGQGRLGGTDVTAATYQTAQVVAPDIQGGRNKRNLIINRKLQKHNWRKQRI